MTSEASRSSMLLRHGPRAWVVCHAYRDRGPILTVVADGPSLTITQVHPFGVVERDVMFARELVSATRRYLAECERRRAAGSTVVAGPTVTAGCDTA